MNYQQLKATEKTPPPAGPAAEQQYAEAQFEQLS